MFAILLDLELSFAFCIHIDLVPVCDIVLIFTDRTDLLRPFLPYDRYFKSVVDFSQGLNLYWE